MTDQRDLAKEVIEDMDNLRHMLGVGEHIAKRNWCYRNYYNAGPRHTEMPSIQRLIASGLVEQYAPEYFRATVAGMRAIGLNDKQIKRAMEQ